MTERAGRAAAVACSLLLGAAAAAGAQTLERRVAAAPDGYVRLSYTARAGVCGNGENITTARRTEHRESWCEPGPVRVLLTMRGGAVTALRAFVGGRWRAAEGDAVTDLGHVPAREAADYLLALAAGAAAAPARSAVFAATLADSAVVWPALLALARAVDRPREVRRAAIFWLGQTATEAATGGLEAVIADPAGDRSVREHAVFALSQRPRDEGIPALIRIARSHEDPAIRKRALFWLAQSGDERAIALFEELLTRR